MGVVLGGGRRGRLGIGWLLSLGQQDRWLRMRASKLKLMQIGEKVADLVADLHNLIHAVFLEDYMYTVV